MKKGDVIALVGGEDMVVAGELGYLELLLTRALPDYQLRFRNLAWEGDTVFEQRRDLNFPPLEAQLDQVGATVVICQFGQMESLRKVGSGKAEGGSEDARKAEIAEFIAAYEKLIERMSGGGKRRVVLISPRKRFAVGTTSGGRSSVRAMPNAAPGAQCWIATCTSARSKRRGRDRLLRIGRRRSAVHGIVRAASRRCHLGIGHVQSTARWHSSVTGAQRSAAFTIGSVGIGSHNRQSPSREQASSPLIRAKNRLWFDYWRVQNWAFLAGDRTNQPSSRDHRDPSQALVPRRARSLPPPHRRQRARDRRPRRPARQAMKPALSTHRKAVDAPLRPSGCRDPASVRSDSAEPRPAAVPAKPIGTQTAPVPRTPAGCTGKLAAAIAGSSVLPKTVAGITVSDQRIPADDERLAGQAASPRANGAAPRIRNDRHLPAETRFSPGLPRLVRYAAASSAASVTPPEPDPNDPAAELASFKLADGFEANLFASEKDGVVKPIQIRWDTRGRLWVIGAPPTRSSSPAKSRTTRCSSSKTPTATGERTRRRCLRMG